MERSKEDQEKIDAIEALVDISRKDGLPAGETLFSAGYRLDPYPNGKTKDEFIDIIANMSANLDKARNFLTVEHLARINETFGITMERHRELRPDCAVCAFLEETSGVKE